MNSNLTTKFKGLEKTFNPNKILHQRFQLYLFIYGTKGFSLYLFIYRLNMFFFH